MILHPMICIFVIFGENLLTGWCRMKVRPARLVSYAFLYTTDSLSHSLFCLVPKTSLFLARLRKDFVSCVRRTKQFLMICGFISSDISCTFFDIGTTVSIEGLNLRHMRITRFCFSTWFSHLFFKKFTQLFFILVIGSFSYH